MNSDWTLFRQEAVDFQRSQQQWGEITLLQPLSTKLLVWFIAGVFALIVVFICVTHYSRKETVPGYLTPASGTAKVSAVIVGFAVTSL